MKGTSRTLVFYLSCIYDDDIGVFTLGYSTYLYTYDSHTLGYTRYAQLFFNLPMNQIP